MNAEKLHAIALAIENDLSKSRILGLLQELTSALQNMVNQPNQPQFQKAFSDARENLRNALLESKIKSFSPAWKQFVNELGGSDLLGYPLWLSIESVFSNNQITPQIALDDIQSIFHNVEKFSQSVEKVVESFGDLHIESEELEPGECEIGILIPRSFVDNKLSKFGAEIDQLNRILGVFSELVTGERPGFEIGAISSSSLSIFLNAAPGICACIALSIERIVALYKSLLEIKKLRSDLAGQGLPEIALKGVEDHAENVMDKGISELVGELVDKFLSGTDEGRANEIKIELRYALKKMAARIDRGFNIEVRMAQPEKVNSEEPGKSAGDLASYETIRDATENMRFINSTGTPILQLPDNGDTEV